MKQIVLLLAFLQIQGSSYSQIISSSSRPVAGDVFLYKMDTVLVDTSSIGLNVSWDFSQLNLPDSIYSDSCYLPSSTQFNNFFSTSNYALYDNWQYIFYRANNTIIEEKGFSNTLACPIVYSNPMKMMKFPFTYGDTLNDNYSYFNDCIMTVFSGNGNISVKGDAVGTLTLPTGVFSFALRVKTVINLISSSSGNRKTIKYDWYTSENKFPVLSYQVVYGMWASPPQVLSKKLKLGVGESYLNVSNKIADNIVSLFPNPTATSINFENKLKYQNLGIFDMTGKQVEEHLLNKYDSNISIDVAKLDSGIYMIVMSNSKNIFRQKIVINH